MSVGGGDRINDWWLTLGLGRGVKGCEFGTGLKGL